MTPAAEAPSRATADAPRDSGAAADLLPLDRRFAGTAVAGVVVAGVTSVVVQKLSSSLAYRLPIPSPVGSQANAGLTTVIVTLALVVLGAAAWFRTRRRLLGTVSTWAALAALVTVILAVPLSRTPLYLGGVTTDQVFRTQLMTRLTDSPALSDMNYAGLAPYYPSGWFWVGGRAAALLGRAGWEIYKPYAIASLAVAAVLTLVLWRTVLPATRALVATTAATLVVVAYGSAEPYGAAVALLGAPALVLAWRGTAGRPGSGRRELVTAGVFLGLVATSYTLYFGVFVLSVVVMAVVAGVQENHLRHDAVRVVVVRQLGRLALAGVPAALVALTVWTPYLFSVLSGAPTSGAAQHYLPPSGTLLPLPMTQVNLLGFLCLTGTVWVLLRWRTSDTAAALGVTALVITAWAGLSMAALAVGTTLLGFRLDVPLESMLVSAGALGLLDGGRRLGELVRDRPTALRGAVRPATAGAVAIAVLGLALAQAGPAALRGEVATAYADPLPGDDRGAGGNATSYPRIDEVISAASPSPRGGTVVLSDDPRFLAYYPYRGFQQFTPHYANPHAEYDARNAEVRRWVAATSPAELLAELDASPWAPPTAFLLSPVGDDLAVSLARDVFPDEPNVEYDQVRFPRALFDDPAFTTAQVGQQVVVVRHG